MPSVETRIAFQPLTDSERVRLLAAALEYCRAKLHGGASAIAMARDGHGRLNLEGAYDCNQEGNVLAARVLEETVGYMPGNEARAILGDRLKEGKSRATVALLS